MQSIITRNQHGPLHHPCITPTDGALPKINWWKVVLRVLLIQPLVAEAIELQDVSSLLQGRRTSDSEEPVEPVCLRKAWSHNPRVHYAVR